MFRSYKVHNNKGRLSFWEVTAKEISKNHNMVFYLTFSWCCNILGAKWEGVKGLWPSGSLLMIASIDFKTMEPHVCKNALHLLVPQYSPLLSHCTGLTSCLSAASLTSMSQILFLSVSGSLFTPPSAHENLPNWPH